MGIEEDYNKIYEGVDNEQKITGEDLCTMIALANFFEKEKRQNGFLGFGKDPEYKSLNHIGRKFENTPNASITIKRLLSKMMKMGFFQINDNNRIMFDAGKFDEFVENHKHGKEWWTYIDYRITYARTK